MGVSTRNKRNANSLPMSSRPDISITATAMDMTDDERRKKQELARKEEKTKPFDITNVPIEEK